MSNQIEITTLQKCVEHDWLVARGFVASDDKTVYVRESTDRRTNETFMFELWINPEVHPELGTNIEVYSDGRLTLSGYWLDHKDFLTDFSL